MIGKLLTAGIVLAGILGSAKSTVSPAPGPTPSPQTPRRRRDDHLRVGDGPATGLAGAAEDITTVQAVLDRLAGVEGRILSGALALDHCRKLLAEIRDLEAAQLSALRADREIDLQGHGYRKMSGTARMGR